METQEVAESLRVELEAEKQEGKEMRAEVEALGAQLLSQEKEVILRQRVNLEVC